MITEIRKKVLHLIEEAVNYAYPIRWADEETTLGDFDGRDVAIEIFFIPATAQTKFLETIRPIRKEIKKIIGDDCIFIFHSEEATRIHYSHLFPIIHRIQLTRGEIKFSLPGPGGTDGKPEVVGTLQCYLEAA